MTHAGTTFSREGMVLGPGGVVMRAPADSPCLLHAGGCGPPSCAQAHVVSLFRSWCCTCTESSCIAYPLNGLKLYSLFYDSLPLECMCSTSNACAPPHIPTSRTRLPTHPHTARCPSLAPTGMCAALCNDSHVGWDKGAQVRIGESTEIALRVFAEKVRKRYYCGVSTSSSLRTVFSASCAIPTCWEVVET